jgi:hypothetical protein
MPVIRDHAARSGRTVMYAFNLTGEVDEMRRRHDLVLAEGGTVVMASMHSVGLTGMLALRRHSQLPIHAHRNGWGALGRHPNHGIFLCRVVQALAAGRGRTISMSTGLPTSSAKATKARSLARSVLSPLWTTCPMLPCRSSPPARRSDRRPRTWAALGSDDLIHAAGGGILAHPKGPRAGVKASARPGPPPRPASPSRRAQHEPRPRDALGAYADPSRGPLVAWLGDDFTGGAAVAETLAFAGLPAAMFLEPPTPRCWPASRAPRDRHRHHARAESPAWMDAHLPSLYAALLATGAPLIQYKACSTMDSAPHLGSLGRALELGLQATGEACAPLLFASPEMGRFQAFGSSSRQGRAASTASTATR